MSFTSVNLNLRPHGGGTRIRLLLTLSACAPPPLFAPRCPNNRVLTDSEKMGNTDNETRRGHVMVGWGEGWLDGAGMKQKQSGKSFQKSNWGDLRWTASALWNMQTICLNQNYRAVLALASSHRAALVPPRTAGRDSHSSAINRSSQHSGDTGIPPHSHPNPHPRSSNVRRSKEQVEAAKTGTGVNATDPSLNSSMLMEAFHSCLLQMCAIVFQTSVKCSAVVSGSLFNIPVLQT